VSQFVIEFGSRNVEPICQVLLKQLPRELSISVSTIAQEAIYSEIKASAEQIMSEISRGLYSSARFRPHKRSLRYGLILPPHFLGQPLSLWTGTFEWIDDGWRSCWETLLNVPELEFVTVGKEEGPEVTDITINDSSNVVWHSPPALITAFREPAQRTWNTVSNILS
jgi:hypothetical protein